VGHYRRIFIHGFCSHYFIRVIKNSFNQLWMIRVDPEQQFRVSVWSRFKSLLLILFTGLLFVTGVVLEALQVLFGKYIDEMIHGSGIFFNGILSFLISILITTSGSRYCSITYPMAAQNGK
jgi:membrane protein